MRSNQPLTQQKGVGSPVLTGDLAMFSAAMTGARSLPAARIKSESTPNEANHFGVLAPITSNLRIQKQAWVTQRSDSPRKG